jgi:hypothetical protein
MKRSIRITILLLILFVVGMDALLTRWRSTDWDQSLVVVVYPINGDNSTESDKFIKYITEDNFKPIESYLSFYAKKHGILLAEPFMVKLAPELKQNPPPAPATNSYLAIIWWSLKTRYWSYKNDTYEEIPANIKVFVRYHAFAEGKRIEHSVGLEKGKTCIVNAYASPMLVNRNQVIIIHEILHTLGATDKYDLDTEMPIYPEGYAMPEQNPLWPQEMAEIMGGYIPLAAEKSIMPATLAETIIGSVTAREIGWLN